MQHLIFFSIGLLAILLVPFLMWRIKASNEFKKYLPLTEKDITDFETQKPVFTKYWISNSFYKDYIDKTRILLNGSKEKFDFSNWGIALKLDVARWPIWWWTMPQTKSGSPPWTSSS